MPLCPSAQLVASTLSESPEPAFLLNAEGVVLYENPPGKRLIFEKTEGGFDRDAGDPKHSYHFSFFFSFSSPTKPWQDFFDELTNTTTTTTTTTTATNTTTLKHHRTFDVNDNGLHSQDYDVVCKRTNGTEFGASLRLAKVGTCPCCPDSTYLCAYVTPKVAFDHNNHPFAKEDSSLRCILNASFDPVFSIDESGTILLTNDAAVKFFGWTHPEFRGRNISMICGGGHAARHDGYIRNFLDSGIPKIIGKQREVPARRKDGTEFPVLLGVKEVSCQEYGMPEGKVVFVAFLKDLSQERQHQLELKHKVDVMQGMINSSFDPMFQINEEGIIRNCNTAAVDLFGFRREEMIDHNISIICGGGHAEHHNAYIQQYLKSGHKRVIGRKRKVVARRKNGTEFEIELGVQEVVSSTGEKLFCGFVRDLTQQVMEKRRMRKHERNVKDHFFAGNEGIASRPHDHSASM